MKLSILPPPTASAEVDVRLPVERTNAEGKAVGNHMLLAIPENEYHAVRPFLAYVSLPHHTTLHEPVQRIEFLYFPNRGLVSLVVPTREGKTVEVGVVGDEGVVGTAAAVGLHHSPHRSVVQISGDGFRINVDRLRSMLPSTPQLQFMVVRYAVIQGIHAAQSAACNRLHGIEQRLARWLLMMQDRVHEGSLRITHDFLAAMLGTDRPSVSLAAGILQKKGTIEYTRGAVRILNRKKLEECSCECYAVIQQFSAPLGV
jgi:CRP-like cAMP-binding protein